MKRINLLILSVLFAVSVVAAAGCALLSDDDRTARLAVQYTTLKFIDGTADVSAADVTAGVQRARATVTQDAAVTLAELLERVRAEIRWDRLDPADTMLVRVLLLEIETDLAERIGDGVLSDEDRASVLRLLDWIESAASMVATE